MSAVPKSFQNSPGVGGIAEKVYTAPVGGAVVRMLINNRPNSSGNASVKVEVRLAGSASTDKGFAWEGAVAQLTPQPLPPFSVGSTDEIWVTSDIVLVAFNVSVIEL